MKRFTSIILFVAMTMILGFTNSVFAVDGLGACEIDPACIEGLTESECLGMPGLWLGEGTTCEGWEPPHGIPEYPTALIPAVIALGGYAAMRSRRRE